MPKTKSSRKNKMDNEKHLGRSGPGLGPAGSGSGLDRVRVGSGSENLDMAGSGPGPGTKKTWARRSLLIRRRSDHRIHPPGTGNAKSWWILSRFISFL